MDLFDPKALETDPNGLAAHEPGAKLDLGKPMVDLTLDGFSRALLAVAQVSTYGAKKYSPNGWKAVPNGEQRYRSAGDRHRLFRGHEVLDPESKLTHLAHEAWNRLAELELYLQSVAGCQPGTPDAVPEQTAAEKSMLREKPATDSPAESKGGNPLTALIKLKAVLQAFGRDEPDIRVVLDPASWDTAHQTIYPYAEERNYRMTRPGVFEFNGISIERGEPC